MPIFAAREIHCITTFPAMYFLLSNTAPVRRLFIIIDDYPFLLLVATNCVSKEKCSAYLPQRNELIASNRLLVYHSILPKTSFQTLGTLILILFNERQAKDADIYNTFDLLYTMISILSIYISYHFGKWTPARHSVQQLPCQPMPQMYMDQIQCIMRYLLSSGYGIYHSEAYKSQDKSAYTGIRKTHTALTVKVR